MLSQIFKGKSVTSLSPVAQDMPAGSSTSNYCVYACFEMILNKYGDQANQKSIELAAIWTGLSPGMNQGVQEKDIPALGNILGLKSTEIMDARLIYGFPNTQLDIDLKGAINNDQPIMLIQPNTKGYHHARLIDGYIEMGGGNIFNVIDPASGNRYGLRNDFYIDYSQAWKFYK